MGWTTPLEPKAKLPAPSAPLVPHLANVRRQTQEQTPQILAGVASIAIVRNGSIDTAERKRRFHLVALALQLLDCACSDVMRATNDNYFHIEPPRHGYSPSVMPADALSANGGFRKKMSFTNKGRECLNLGGWHRGATSTGASKPASLTAIAESANMRRPPSISRCIWFHD
ncbi:hypothetical protein DPM33_00775 [Mesorhizobium hawassense]|uniref:Uncharacterized protein n=1 Tax=Mesorhizobium hawassense TaxID=1209954 RepID=A0A330HV02_9HYPH|nr:hypothetical protein DPM33_00775 [Mesorhizobium hawassense]